MNITFQLGNETITRPVNLTYLPHIGDFVIVNDLANAKNEPKMKFKVTRIDHLVEVNEVIIYVE